MVDLLSMDLLELRSFLKGLNQPSFRAKQIYKWLMQGVGFEGMSNIPATLREELSKVALACSVSIKSTIKSKIDGTEKFLFELIDGNLIEGVLMRYKHGITLCVSTQVGCKMGCVFCASSLEGCVRNLSAGEMLGQIICANRLLLNDHVGNVVLMGSGEPLDNYDNTIKFIKLMHDIEGLNISLRGVSLSTCGIVPKMHKLAEEGLPITLSVSLHAPNDLIRERIMPIAKLYKIDEIIEECKYYIHKTGRRVIFEYALINGVNGEVKHAIELSNKLRGMQCHVNLIPLNDVPERGLTALPHDAIVAFQKELEARHISVTMRREMGDDIAGACGQLRRREIIRE